MLYAEFAREYLNDLNELLASQYYKNLALNSVECNDLAAKLVMRC